MLRTTSRNLNPILLLPFALAAFASGCSKSASAVATTPVAANVKLTSDATAVSGRVASSDLNLGFSDPQIQLTAGGASAGTGGLTSLKYYIETIAICNSLTTSGTAYSNPQGCISLYSGPTDSILNPLSGQTLPPDYASQTTYAAGVTTGYIDLMSTSDRAAIAASSGRMTAGSYSWGYISWAYPIKVTATIPVANLYTHAATISNTTGPGGGPLATATSSLATGPASEAIVPLANGGTWFKFQSPFVISDADVSAGTAYTVDLTFNPDNLIRGFAAPNSPSNLSFVDGTLGGSTTNAINVPMLDLTPVPRKSTDKTYVETYLSTSLSGTTDTFTIRLELYYNSSDAKKSIYGATLRVIPSATTQWATDIAKIAFVANNTSISGAIDFQDYAQNPIISAFTRGSAVGNTTTATIPCSGANATSNFSPAGCASGSSVTANFQLSSIKSL